MDENQKLQYTVIILVLLRFLVDCNCGVSKTSEEQRDFTIDLMQVRYKKAGPVAEGHSGAVEGYSRPRAAMMMLTRS